eukprot:362937-Chlamydomonas_euryale.AAC.1
MTASNAFSLRLGIQHEFDANVFLTHAPVIRDVVHRLFTVDGSTVVSVHVTQDILAIRSDFKGFVQISPDLASVGIHIPSITTELGLMMSVPFGSVSRRDCGRARSCWRVIELPFCSDDDSQCGEGRACFLGFICANKAPDWSPTCTRDSQCQSNICSGFICTPQAGCKNMYPRTATNGGNGGITVVGVCPSGSYRAGELCYPYCPEGMHATSNVDIYCYGPCECAPTTAGLLSLCSRFGQMCGPCPWPHWLRFECNCVTTCNIANVYDRPVHVRGAFGLHCPGGTTQIGLLCYDQCPPLWYQGSGGLETSCFRNCPD